MMDGGVKCITTVVRNIRTIELLVKDWYDLKHEALGSSVDRRHNRRGNPARPVRPCARRHLCKAGGLVRSHYLLKLPSDQRSQRSQIHAVTTFQGAAGSGTGPKRAARGGDAQH